MNRREFLHGFLYGLLSGACIGIGTYASALQSQKRNKIMPRPPVSILGLDIGKERDPAALAHVVRHERPGPDGWAEHWYSVEGLIQFPLKMPYTTQHREGLPDEIGLVESVRDIIRGQPHFRGCMMGVDKTGVGNPVVDMLREAQLDVWLRPIQITSGEKSALQEDGGFHVPKAELVTALEIVIQNARIAISPFKAKSNRPEDIEYAKRANATRQLLAEEFRHFNRVARKNQKAKLGAEGDKHDDLALSVALAVWLGENAPVGWDGSLGVDPQPIKIPQGVFAQSRPEDKSGERIVYETPMGASIGYGGGQGRIGQGFVPEQW
jgi:hypothetical protein